MPGLEGELKIKTKTENETYSRALNIRAAGGDWIFRKPKISYGLYMSPPVSLCMLWSINNLKYNHERCLVFKWSPKSLMVTANIMGLSVPIICVTNKPICTKQAFNDFAMFNACALGLIY